MIKRLCIVLGIIVVAVSACQKTETARENSDSLVLNSPYFTSDDNRIEIDGLKIRYRDEGPKDAPRLVMIHGFSSSLETWDELAKQLVDDFRIVRLDLPGHGLTGPDVEERYTNEDTVEILSQFLEKLDITDPVIIGNSLGGLVAWRFASATTDKPQGLILISPGGFSINGVTDEPVSVPMMVKIYLTKAPKSGVEAATKNLFADPEKVSEERITQIRDLMLFPGNGEALVKRAGTFTLPAPNADLAKVTSPTLILWGDEDRMVPPEHGNEFVDVMPNATLKTYKNAGHVPQEEIPEQVAQDIRTFIASLGSTP